MLDLHKLLTMNLRFMSIFHINSHLIFEKYYNLREAIMTNLEKAIDMLQGDLTCVICGEGICHTSVKRGVAPLLDLLEQGQNVTGCSAADKVVGNGAAYLYVLLGVRELYAGLISRPALATLQQHEIKVAFGEIVEGIRNRAGDGPCPIESAVEDALSPDDALVKIRAKLAQMRKN